MQRFVLAFLLLSLGCGGSASTPDAAMVNDAMESPDATVMDAPAIAVDAPAIAVDAPAPLSTAVELSYRSQSGTFDRAWLGYHRTAGTLDGLYFEISRGADDVCPSASSPIPQQLFTVDGIVFDGAVPFTRTTGMSVNFFDFEGTFRTEVAPGMATEVSVEVTAFDESAGTASAAVRFTFGTDGSASGSVWASHCDSLDTSD